MRPTTAAALLFSFSVPLALLIVTLWPGAWYAALYFPLAMVALLVADASMALPSRRLGLTAKTPVRLYIGDKGEVAVRLDAADYTRPLAVDALLEIDGEAEAPTVARITLAEGNSECQLPVTPIRRGKVVVQALWLRWTSPLGLLAVQSRRVLDSTIEIIPNVRGLHEEALQFFSRDAMHGFKTQRLRGEGTEFDKLGEFAPGMDNRFIDWKRSARHRKLLCKEFRQERNHNIVLAFDTGHLMLEPIAGAPKLDHAVKAGLVLGWVSLYGGDVVGGCGFDVRFRNFVQPGRGMRYFTQLQRFATGLEYRTEETNFYLGLTELYARLGKRSLIVLFSEFVDSIAAELLLENLHLLLKRHLVMFVTLRDPMLHTMRAAKPSGFMPVAEAVIANDFIRERSVVLEKIQRLGVHCLDVPVDGLSTAVLNRYLLIKQRGLL